MDNQRIAIVDLDSVAYSAFHPNKVLDEFGIPLRENNKFVYKEKTEEEIIASVDSCMHYVLGNSEATHYIGYIKGKGNFRYSIDENYKGNRSSESPKHWELVKSKFIETWKAVEVNGIEVDDAVNITYRSLDNSFIAAIDKDILFLENKEGFSHYNWRKKEWVYTSKDRAIHKLYYDLIVGQSGDNIKGIKGKGDKAAINLFEGVLTQEEYFNVVYSEYLKVYGYEGMFEYYKNYNLLKILDSYDSFVIPKIQVYNKQEFNVFEL